MALVDADLAIVVSSVKYGSKSSDFLLCFTLQQSRVSAMILCKSRIDRRVVSDDPENQENETRLKYTCTTQKGSEHV